MEAEANSEKKDKKRALSAIIALAFACLFILFGILAPHRIDLPCKPENQSVQQCPTDDFPSYVISGPLAYIDVHNGLFQALAALASAVFAGVLYFVSRQQKDIAVRQTEHHLLENRAFVFLESFAISKGWSNGFVTSVKIVAIFKNSGVTPTRNLLANINFENLTYEELASFNYRPNYETATSANIGPQGIAHIASDEINMLSLPNGDALIVWGWIEYDDIFPATERHRTEFCNQVIPILKEQGATEDMPFSYILFGRHNGADGECMYKPQSYTKKK